MKYILIFIILKEKRKKMSIFWFFETEQIDFGHF
jgi:hypothetical protein